MNIKTKKTNNHLTIVDLFAGAGGLSEGFQRKGFKIVAYVEKDKYACETLLTRHIYHQLKNEKCEKIYYDYLKGRISKEDFYKKFNSINPVINEEISDKTIVSIEKSIRDNMKLMKVKSIDVFIGGPPCQAYSIVGRARDPYGMKNDPRNILYKYYVTLLKKFRPKMFVFENVPGILSAGNGKLWNDVKLYFKNAGYDIAFKILDASDFMVLQKRRRVILIGWKKDKKLYYPDFHFIKHNYFVRDILIDLPHLKSGQCIEVGDYISEPTEYLQKTGIRTENDILIQHTTRLLSKNNIKIYNNVVKLWKIKHKRFKYSDLPDNLKTHKNVNSFTDRFKVVCDDLQYSHALVAHIAKDDRYYMHPDIKQKRNLSVREAARIQSFSDNYKFEGPRTSQLIQIGNAVPPLMAEKIAEKIKEMLN